MPEPNDRCDPCPEYCPLCDHLMKCEKCINHYGFMHLHETREGILADDGRKVLMVSSHSWSDRQ